jgi:UPF0755 protein
MKKHGFLKLFQASLAFYVLAIGFSMVTIYIDDIDGIWYATTVKLEQLTDNMKRYTNVGAVYIATEDTDLARVYVVEGWRKEQIAEAFQKKLNWTDEEMYDFAEMYQCNFGSIEGKLFPTSYVVPQDAKPEDVKEVMQNIFAMRVGTSTESLATSTPLNLDKITIIASLIQREAGGKRDMNIISGVIWNRIMNDMPLGIDATLQYIKGTEGNWWPQVKSADKSIESPYNTYQNKGLPPHPIANPGIAAIAAAMNPANTSCLYYIHDNYGRIHCSKTYEGHKQNIAIYLK